MITSLIVCACLVQPARAVTIQSATVTVEGTRQMAEVGEPFGQLGLVDEVVCGSARDKHPFRESGQEISGTGTILGRECRVISPGSGPRWMAWKIGEGKGLQARGAYVLAIDLPDDRPRTTIVVNRGCDMMRGVATAGALGDRLWGPVDSRIEAIYKIPHSRKYLTQKLFFFLHDRTADLVLTKSPMRRPLRPADGFWVAILAPALRDDPVSAGAAVARIRLFEVPDPGAYVLEPNLPQGVPHRLVFAREAWSAAITEGDGEGETGMDNMDAFFEFRARQARFLGMNAIAPDLLTANRNQGWDAGDDEWYAPPRDPMRWEKMLQVFDSQGLTAVPYLEYAGSLALNRTVKCRPLGRENVPYTNVAGGEAGHVDVTDPQSVEDAKLVLERTVVRFRDQFRIAGVWLRTRTGAWPVSYTDAAIARFAADANGNWPPPRADFAKDADLRGRYEAWYLGKRSEFLIGLRDDLRRGYSKAELFVTPWGDDAGPGLSERKRLVVTDVPADFQGNLQGPSGEWGEAIALRRVVGDEMHLKAIQAFPGNRGNWDWHDATPPADPGKYWDTKGVLFTYPVSRMYTAMSSTAFDAFRGPDGLAAVRWFCPNAGLDAGTLGGIVADIDRAGPYCMMTEALAVANGDPIWLGILASNTFTSSFPEYARRFYAAYLALPAEKSQRMWEWSPDPEVVVRVIWPETKGAYLAVVNTSYLPKKEAAIVLSWDGQVTNAASGQILDSLKSKIKVKKKPKEEGKDEEKGQDAEKDKVAVTATDTGLEDQPILKVDLAPFELLTLRLQ